jgi:hypothetical protein
MNDNQALTTRVVLRNVRLAYADQLITPRAFAPGQPEKYGGTLLMPPGHPGLDAIEAAAKAAAAAHWRNKKPKLLRGIHRDPIIKDCADYPKIGITESGWSFVRVSSLDQPVIVDNRLQELNKADWRREVYSGRWATVSVNAFAYEQTTGSGVSLGLGNIQLLQHDTRLGSPRPTPEDEFDPIEDLPESDNDNHDLEADDADFVQPTPRRRR